MQNGGIAGTIRCPELQIWCSCKCVCERERLRQRERGRARARMCMCMLVHIVYEKDREVGGETESSANNMKHRAAELQIWFSWQTPGLLGTHPDSCSSTRVWACVRVHILYVFVCAWHGGIRVRKIRNGDKDKKTVERETEKTEKTMKCVSYKIFCSNIWVFVSVRVYVYVCACACERSAKKEFTQYLYWVLKT